MYNKIRMGIMLAGFMWVTISALSYSGTVSGTCRHEWEFLDVAKRSPVGSYTDDGNKNLPGPGINQSESGSVSGNLRKIKNELTSEEGIIGKDNNEAGYNVGKSVGKRLSDLDLIIPNFLFGL
jgi:hypothetical protein